MTTLAEPQTTWDAPEADPPTNRHGELLRVLNVNNHHAGRGGYEVYFFGQNRILKENGHFLKTLEADNADVVTLGQKLSAFATSIASKRAATRIKDLIEEHRIDLVHLHNVLPLLSPDAITGCRQAYDGRGVPIVMKLADYKLTCPAGQHLRDGKICTKCLGGREYWAGIHGCRENHLWSTAYALRNVAARRRRIFHDGVTLFLPNTRFVLEHFVAAGFDRGQMHLLPNFTDLQPPTQESLNFGQGDYACYVGRISPEKGLPTLLAAAAKTGIPTRIAGNHTNMPGLAESAPANVEFVGKLDREQLVDFYRRAKFMIVPSEWYECFGISAAEAQTYGLPVIATDLGGLPEVVRNDESGLIYRAGDVDDLAAAMTNLWEDDALAARLGQGAWQRAAREFRPDVFYRRLCGAYTKAIQLHERSRRA
ncbi:MAG: glycosyltransferase family 4 protein [Planctomycetota bacterium]